MVALKQNNMNRGRLGLVFQAFPERTGYLGFSTDEGGFEVVSPGVFQLTAPMISQLTAHAAVFRYPSGVDQSHSNVGWLVNICGDPEEYGEALEYLGGLLAKSHFPTLNKPEQVLAVRRDRLASTLGQSNDVQTLRTVRFFADDRDLFRKHFEQADMSYPVMVQVAGERYGHKSVVIRSDGDWDQIFSIPWGDRWVYLSQLPRSNTLRRIRVIVTPYGCYVTGVSDGELSREAQAQANRIGKNVRSTTGLDFAQVEVLLDEQGHGFVLDISAAPEMRPDPSHLPYQRKALRDVERDMWRKLREFTGLPLKMQLIHKL